MDECDRCTTGNGAVRFLASRVPQLEPCGGGYAKIGETTVCVRMRMWTSRATYTNKHYASGWKFEIGDAKCDLLVLIMRARADEKLKDAICIIIPRVEAPSSILTVLEHSKCGRYEKYMVPMEKAAERIMEIVPRAKTPKCGVKPISGGYECSFMLDGKKHVGYGRSEAEARINANKRKEELEARKKPPKEKPKEEPKKDTATITIQGDEAIVLCDHLFHALRNKTVDEKDVTVLRSIYLRLATQLI